MAKRFNQRAGAGRANKTSRRRVETFSAELLASAAKLRSKRSLPAAVRGKFQPSEWCPAAAIPPGGRSNGDRSGNDQGRSGTMPACFSSPPPPPPPSPLTPPTHRKERRDPPCGGRIRIPWISIRFPRAGPGHPDLAGICRMPECGIVPPLIGRLCLLFHREAAPRPC